MADSMFTVAIDFGTAYSGYCFCVRNCLDNIRSVFWGQELGFGSPKTPTCILFDEHEQFQKFGYEAMMTYIRLSKEEAKKYFFFENFKMELYNKTIHRNLMIPAASGKTLRALKVFSESLRYLKDHVLKNIQEHTSGKKFIPSDVTWVLTVPAIWDAAAKQFMREAATQAGLVTESNPNQLILALEPEAASVWCKQLPREGFVAEGRSEDTLEQTSGTQYIVVDCGGGTIDITVHEVLEDGFLKELHKASGGDMGGETVNKKFKSFLTDIFHSPTWDKYVRDHPAELQKMMYEFSVQKSVGEDKDIYISCPYNLSHLAGEKQDMSSYFCNAEGVFWSDGSIKITYKKLQSFFAESVGRIVSEIQTIISALEISIDYILLVGGYASCKYLQKEIRMEFGRRCRILCPIDANMAVAKGAVLFGHNPKIVASRVSALTYGIAVGETFDSRKHKMEKQTVNDKGDYVYCDDIFKRMVQKGQSVKCDEEIVIADDTSGWTKLKRHPRNAWLRQIDSHFQVV
ncbi:heat shock 70 kDa protein 12A-like [Brienomyrus brachyistius]|uniref:heat shock 70 kDa protein 12A-like n=1 Tax=Brienomyrus brachyistius TaxID=42636 RepID=UPI0020B3503E|nr:heat shock 70 kDa protein 12A-like [Brienomyrus brachyistius]